MLRFIVLYSRGFFSQGKREERRGWAVLCCTVQLLTSHWIPSPPFIPQLVPRRDGWVPPPSDLVKYQTNASELGDRQSLEGLWASVMFAIGDCRNCQRVGESTDHSLLVRSWSGRMDMWMRTISLGGYNNCFGSFSSQIVTKSHKWKQDWWDSFSFFLFLFLLEEEFMRR